MTIMTSGFWNPRQTRTLAYLLARGFWAIPGISESLVYPRMTFPSEVIPYLDMGYPILEKLNLGYTKLGNLKMGYPWYIFCASRTKSAVWDILG